MSAVNGASATGLRILSRDEILAAHDLAREMVAVPEWGDDAGVLVQAMDVNRRLVYWEFIFVREKNPETGAVRYETRDGVLHNAAVVALCVIDEQGEPVFSMAELELIGSKNPDTLNRIAQIGLRLSGLAGDSEAVKAEAPLVQNGASHTDSPAISA